MAAMKEDRGELDLTRRIEELEKSLSIALEINDKFQRENKKLTDEELKEVSKLQKQLNDHIDTDKMMVVLNAKVSAAEEKVDVLKEIIRSINNRGYQLKNAIDWHRLTMG